MTLPRGTFYCSEVAGYLIEISVMFYLCVNFACEVSPEIPLGKSKCNWDNYWHAASVAINLDWSSENLMRNVQIILRTLTFNSRLWDIDKNEHSLRCCWLNYYTRKWQSKNEGMMYFWRPKPGNKFAFQHFWFHSLEVNGFIWIGFWLKA